MSETTDNSDMALRQQLTQGGYEVALLNERQRRIAAEEERDALAAELEAVKRVEAHLLADGRRSVTTEYTGGRLLIGYEVPAIPMHHEAAFDSYAEGDTLPALGRALAAQEGR